MAVIREACDTLIAARLGVDPYPRRVKRWGRAVAILEKSLEKLFRIGLLAGGRFLVQIREFNLDFISNFHYAICQKSVFFQLLTIC